MKKRRLDFGIPIQGCKHPNTLFIATSSVLQVHDDGEGPLLSADVAVWCRECGAIRFALQGHFVVPQRARVR